MDGVHVILEKEIVGEEAPITKARYIPGVCMFTKDNEENEVIRYYHEDALGSFIAMTDEEQNITALYQYDAWGNELLTQVSALRPQPPENPYRWCGAWGYYRDADAQLYLLGMRWYDPQMGRFISRDPVEFAGGDANLNRYSRNNLVNLADPTGLQPTFSDWGATSFGTPSGRYVVLEPSPVVFVVGGTTFVYRPGPNTLTVVTYTGVPWWATGELTVPACPSDYYVLENDPRWCRDTHSYLHFVSFCYRSIPNWTFGPGQQCCYHYRTKKFTGASPDFVSPVIGKEANGDCKIRILSARAWGHFVWDIVP
jgi:RHS repeat-associated protein